MPPTDPDCDPTAGFSHAPEPGEAPGFAPGDMVAGRFRVLRLVARGGMGEVYEAEDCDLGVHLALKAIRPSLVDDPAVGERFRQEVLLARSVTHPNICRIFDVVRHATAEGEPRTLITMELLSGETLAERLRSRGRLEPGETLGIARQIASALSAAHAQGVVHRDLKTANVMLVRGRDGSERAVVTDFGLALEHAGPGEPASSEPAVPVSATASTAFREGFVGTPAYVAPELISGGPVTPAADVYSFGVVLYELVTGRLPFTGPTASEVAQARLTRDPESPRQIVRDLDPAWERVLLRCLQLNPQDRFPGAAAVVEALAPLPPRRGPRRLALALLAVAALAVAFALRRSPPAAGPSSPAAAAFRTIQVTTASGLDLYPAFSPDGLSLAFASDRSGSLEIWVRSLDAAGTERQVTGDGAENVQPAWSPDGRFLAFHSRRRGGIWVVPGEGGEARPLSSFGSRPAFSPDGATVAFQSEPLTDISWTSVAALPPSTIWVVPASGGEPRQVTRMGSPAGGHGGPRFDLRGQRIAFTAYDRVRSEIWSVSSDGRDLVRLPLPRGQRFATDPAFSGNDAVFYTTTEAGEAGIWTVRVGADGVATTGAPVQVASLGLARVRHLALAPKGERLAYSAMSTTANLWEVALSPAGKPRGEPRQLTRETARSARPVFSPDGRRIALYRWQQGRSTDVWVLDADGSHPTQLTVTPSSDFMPTWFPSGDRLAFLSNRSGHFAVWSLEVASRTASPLRDLGSDVDFAWLSPDGRSLAVNWRGGKKGPINVWIVPVEGSPPRQLTFDAELAGFPVWSPDGTRLALEVKRGVSTHVAVVPAAGGPVRQLTAEEGESWPHSWAPDGDRIAFAASREGRWSLRWVSARTGRGGEILPPERLDAYYRYPSWSPSGDRLVYERGQTQANIWMVEPVAR